MAAGAGMTLAQIDLERPGHDVCAQDVVGVALVALNGVTLDHARPVGKRERLEFGVGTASAVNPVAPSTFDIPALTLPHTVLSREKQVRRACPSPDRSRHCARTQKLVSMCGPYGLVTLSPPKQRDRNRDHGGELVSGET